MKNLILFSALFIGVEYHLSAQLQLDNQLQMTGATDAERRITNVGTPLSAADAANAASVQSGALTYATATGAGGNYAVTLSPAPAAYTPGMLVHFKANHDNAGAATLQINGLAAVEIKTGVTNDLSSGEIVTGEVISVIYDGANFQLLNAEGAAAGAPPAGPATGDLDGSYPNPGIAANAITSPKIADGTITADDLAPTGVAAGTYGNVTVNNKGQVLAGTSLTGTNYRAVYAAADGSLKTPAIFHCTGADQTYTVPAGVTSVTVYMWGAGGGSGNPATGSSYGFYGGAGGYTSGTISVTPGTTYSILVGQGGGSGAMANLTGTFGGGGKSCNLDCRFGGQGGGRSAFRNSTNTTDLMTAGGGGGGGVSVSSGNSNRGGAGGGLTAQAGESSLSGSGGIQTTGGVGGLGGQSSGTAGTQYQGGNPSGNLPGSGGGGGYYGGGGGGYSSSTGVGSGGGGSGYVSGSGVIGVTTAGNYNIPAGTTNPFYQHGVATGGMGGYGGNGLVVIIPD